MMGTDKDQGAFRLSERGGGKLLVSIDRGNPKGKRDYAIILMAARLGLRAQDICNLCFNNLKWATNTLKYCRRKRKSRWFYHCWRMWVWRSLITLSMPAGIRIQQCDFPAFGPSSGETGSAYSA